MSKFTYRKKPVEIEAYQLAPDDTETRQLPPPWLVEGFANRTVTVFDDGTLEIPTKEGKMKADIGDWIIRGVKGELYPCKPDIFEMTYDKVN